MRKKQTPRKAAKELWPGAGSLALDWEAITGGDFEKVEEWLEGLKGTDERLKMLDTLKTHFEYERGKVATRLYEEAENAPYHPYALPYVPRDQYLERSGRFRDRLEAKISQLRKLKAIEDRDRITFDFSKLAPGKEARKLALEIKRLRESQETANSSSVFSKFDSGWTDVPAGNTGKTQAQEVEDDPAPGKWTNEQAAVALYALLRAAGLPSGVSDRAVGRFANLLTGRSAKKMAEAHHNAAFGSFTDEAAKAAADALTDIGLPKVAADVRKKFEN